MMDNNDKKNALQSMIAAQVPTYKSNPYWIADSSGHPISRETNNLFSPLDHVDVLNVAREYFKLVWDMFHTEAQVACVTRVDWEKIKHYPLPVIEQPNDNLVMLVLPQENSWGLTTVSEIGWHRIFDKNDIYPIARIHSHHTLDAYQSSTDWSSLNSNTLEIVLGKILDDEYQIAYWLDVAGTLNKDNVWGIRAWKEGVTSILA